MLTRLAAALGRHVGGAGGRAAAAAAEAELCAEQGAGAAGGAADLGTGGEPDGVGGPCALEAMAAEAADAAVAAIRRSCLMPFLERQLVGASFTDMASRCAPAALQQHALVQCSATRCYTELAQHNVRAVAALCGTVSNTCGHTVPSHRTNAVTRTARSGAHTHSCRLAASDRSASLQEHDICSRTARPIPCLH